MTYGCIVSYHTNPYTCGIARFNQSLARSFGVDVVSVAEFISDVVDLPLLSLKLEEMTEQTALELFDQLSKSGIRFDLLLHGIQNSELERRFLLGARKVIVASAEHSDEIRPLRHDVVTLFAPGASPTGDSKSFDLSLLTFGMAHKIRADGYRKLGQILRTDHRSIQLEISTALHEGTSFSEEFFSVNTDISEAFQGNVRFLGFLADAEVSRRMREADALVAFFPAGVRENNTTVLSAMAHGCAVITNVDHYSPKWMKHGESIFDIDRLSAFPSNRELKEVGQGALTAIEPYTFERLSELLTKPQA